MNLSTIGVYGCNEESFFAALSRAGIDTFCDIRWRRGVRGKDYSFVNSKRLQKRLAEMGIRYLHLRELAPPPELRKRQYEADKKQGVTKRHRSTLGEAFAEGYGEQVLNAFNSAEFVEKLGSSARNVVLFCVEREPSACHRSIVAKRLEQDLGVTITHLIPEPCQ